MPKAVPHTEGSPHGIHHDRRRLRSWQGRPRRPVDRLSVDDHQVAPGPGEELATRLQQPENLAFGQSLFIVGIENAVFIEKDVQRSRDSNTALGSHSPKAALQHTGVGCMHLQAHLARSTFSPTPLGDLPTEIEHASAAQAIAANVVLVEFTIGAIVRIVQLMREDAEGGKKMFECASLSGG